MGDWLIEQNKAGMRFCDLPPGAYFGFADGSGCEGAYYRLTNWQYTTSRGVVHTAEAAERDAEVVLLKLAGVDGETLLLRRVGVRGDG